MMIQPKPKPKATVSLDMDNKWAYLKTHGDSGWQSYPSYLDIFIPRILERLERLDLRITFFIVGKDAANAASKDLIKALSDAGHEIANHSFSHDPMFMTYSSDQVKKEIHEAQAHIERATGQNAVGFRGPGFSSSAILLTELAQAGFLYDATVFPTFLGPLARTYYFATSSLTDEEKEKLKGLYGKWADGFRPNSPFVWQLPTGRELIEIPTTTMPVFKTPIHMTYLMYIASFSIPLMFVYFKTVVTLLRMTKTPVSFLLHPLDLMGSDLIPELSFFPGMRLSSSLKTTLFDKVISLLADRFDLVTLNEYARTTRISKYQTI